MKKLMMTLAVTLALIAGGQQAMAEGSMRHSAQASHHSVQASGHAVVAGAKVSAAVVAVPLIAASAIGSASSQMGEALLRASGSDFCKPLMVTEETVTAGPAPSRALYREQE